MRVCKMDMNEVYFTGSDTVPHHMDEKVQFWDTFQGHFSRADTANTRSEKSEVLENNFLNLSAWRCLPP